MQNSNEIFTIALGLSEPWLIEDVRIDRTSHQLDIYIAFTRGYKFSMPDGEPSYFQASH